MFKVCLARAGGLEAYLETNLKLGGRAAFWVALYFNHGVNELAPVGYQLSWRTCLSKERCLGPCASGEPCHRIDQRKHSVKISVNQL